METVTVHVMPRNKFRRINTTKAVLASWNRNEAGYIIGVIDHLCIQTHENEIRKIQ